MKQHIARINLVEKITHDVLRVTTEKPEQYAFTPGQATEVVINKPNWINEKRPFTFTSLPGNDYLEFTIKTYPSHEGVTNQLLQLSKDDELIIHEPFGAITYSGEGVFIAGGAGVTPFISIFRDLYSKNEIGNNKLLFSNKTEADIILQHELSEMLGANFINILSQEKVDGYANGQITEDFIKANCTILGQQFYLCGPPPMMEAIEQQLDTLHVAKQSITKEAF